MLTFLHELMSALGRTLGANIATIMCTAGVLFVLYVLLTSKRARIIVASIKDALIKRLMVIPFVAESVYDKTIDGYQKDLNDWEKYEKDLQAELASHKSSYQENLDTINKSSRKMEQAMKHGDEPLAMEYAESIVIAEEDNKLLEEKYIPRMENALAAVRERMADLRSLITRTKARKKDALRNMRGGKLEERLTDSLNGNDDTEPMLQFFEERAEYQRNRGTGARMAYEQTIEYKDKKMDREITKDRASQLLEEYRRKKLITSK